MGAPRSDKCRSNETGILSIRPPEGHPFAPVEAAAFLGWVA
jgi:hypothetical protein